MTTVALVLAGGRGQRVAGEKPKQFLRLEGRPLLYYSLQAFEGLAGVSSIAVVVPPEYAQIVQVRMDLKRFGKVKAIVAGGRLRQDSVMNGLDALPEGVQYVIIHDGARPFPPMDATTRALEAARECGAAILALPLTDTVKMGDDQGFISQTLNRNHIWLAQTPQVFRRDIILEAYQKVRQKGIEVTDDAGAVEAIGKPVRLIQGSSCNIKVTVKEDFGVAIQILHRLGEGTS